MESIIKANNHKSLKIHSYIHPKNAVKYATSPKTIPSLTVGSHGDEGSGSEEQDEDHVAAEEEPSQSRQVVEPGGRVSV